MKLKLPRNIRINLNSPFFTHIAKVQLRELEAAKRKAVQNVEKTQCFRALLFLKKKLDANPEIGRMEFFLGHGKELFISFVYAGTTVKCTEEKNGTFAFERAELKGPRAPLGIYDISSRTFSSYYYWDALYKEGKGIVTRTSERIWEIVGRIFRDKDFYYPASGVDFEIMRHNIGRHSHYIFQDPNLADNEYAAQQARKHGATLISSSITDLKSLESDLTGKSADVLINKIHNIEWSRELLGVIERTLFKNKEFAYVVDFGGGNPSLYELLSRLGYKKFPLPWPLEGLGTKFSKLSGKSTFEQINLDLPPLGGGIKLPAGYLPALYFKNLSPQQD